jgi:hypothetical protein
LSKASGPSRRATCCNRSGRRPREPWRPAAHKVGRKAHVLHAAGNPAVEQAKHRLLRGGRRGLRAGAANPVDGLCRDLHGNAATHRRLACRIHVGGRLNHISDQHQCPLSHRWARNASTPLERRWSEFGCWHPFEAAPKGPRAVRTGLQRTISRWFMVFAPSGCRESGQSRFATPGSLKCRAETHVRVGQIRRPPSISRIRPS